MEMRWFLFRRKGRAAETGRSNGVHEDRAHGSQQSTPKVEEQWLFPQHLGLYANACVTYASGAANGTAVGRHRRRWPVQSPR